VLWFDLALTTSSKAFVESPPHHLLRLLTIAIANAWRTRHPTGIESGCIECPANPNCTSFLMLRRSWDYYARTGANTLVFQEGGTEFLSFSNACKRALASFGTGAAQSCLYCRFPSPTKLQARSVIPAPLVHSRRPLYTAFAAPPIVGICFEASAVDRGMVDGTANRLVKEALAGTR